MTKRYAYPLLGFLLSTAACSGSGIEEETNIEQAAQPLSALDTVLCVADPLKNPSFERATHLATSRTPATLRTLAPTLGVRLKSQLLLSPAVDPNRFVGSVLGNMGASDIEALTFLVLMQAAASAREDLKAIMAEVKAIANAKAKVRELLAAAASAGLKGNDAGAAVPACTSTALDLLRLSEMTARYARTKASVGEMNEAEALRLQMVMDRMSKMISTLSNLLKKISDTSSAITQNIK